MNKAKKNCGIALLVIGGISMFVGFVMYAVEDPVKAAEFLGTVKKSSRPKTTIVRRRTGLFGSYTETVRI